MSARVSDTDMAAVGTALGIWHPAYFFSIGVIMVLSPVLARSYGEANHKKLAEQFNNGLWLALIVCIITSLALNFSDQLFNLLKLETDLASIGLEYLFYLNMGLPFICITACYRFLNEAVGQTKPLMIISIVSIILNIPLNAIFIYGWLSIPAFGGAGCGIATSIVNLLILLSLIWFTYLFPKTKSAIKEFKLKRPCLHELKRLALLGFPIGITVFMELALFGAVALAIATHGTAAAAAHQIALNVTTNFYMVPLSIGFATTAIVGRKIGENQLDQAKQYARASLLMSISFSIISCSIIIIFRDVFISWFTTDPEITLIAFGLLIWAGIFQLPDVIQTLVSAILRGYADTQKPMIIVLISYWFIGFPLGYILAETDFLIPAIGVQAYWIGLLISLSTSAILLSLRLTYKNKKALV